MLSEFPRISLKGGEYAYKEGDPADRSFLLLTGGIEIRKSSGSPLVQQIRPGRLFGVIDIIAKRGRVNDARCTKDSQLILIPDDYITDSVSQTDAFLQAIIRISCERITQLYPDLW